MRDVFPLAVGKANLVGVGVGGEPQREKGGILSIIIYCEPPPACSVIECLFDLHKGERGGGGAGGGDLAIGHPPRAMYRQSLVS